MEKELLFVYGTLKKGGRFHHILKNCKLVHEFALVLGMLEHNDKYPFLKYSDSSVVAGSIYEVDKKTLEEVDWVEDFNENLPYEENLYDRKKTNAILVDENNGTIECWVYYGNKKLFSKYPVYYWDNQLQNVVLATSKFVRN